MLGSGEGEGRWLSKANRDALVFRLRNLVTKSEAKAHYRSFKEGRKEWLEEVDSDMVDGIRYCHNGVRQEHGAVAAERYARQVQGVCSL